MTLGSICFTRSNCALWSPKTLSSAVFVAVGTKCPEEAPTVFLFWGCSAASRRGITRQQEMHSEGRRNHREQQTDKHQGEKSQPEPPEGRGRELEQGWGVRSAPRRKTSPPWRHNHSLKIWAGKKWGRPIKSQSGRVFRFYLLHACSGFSLCDHHVRPFFTKRARGNHPAPGSTAPWREQGTAGPSCSPQSHPRVSEENLFMISLFFKWCSLPIYPGFSTLALICLEIGWFRSSRVSKKVGFIRPSLFIDKFMLCSREIIKNYILCAYTSERLNLGEITVSWAHFTAWLQRGAR